MSRAGLAMARGEAATLASMTEANSGSRSPAAGEADPAPARRTQAERSAAMRQRLLDATVDCLVAYGYSGTTGPRVAELAGVSRGAQLHHFGSKEDLVAAAVEHLAKQRMTAATDQLWRITESADRAPAILDFLWENHRSRFFVASVELWVAARTDPVLAEQIARVEPVVVGAVLAAVARVLPDEAARKDLRHATYTVMDAMRGLMLWHYVDGEEARLERRWIRARTHLLGDFAAALDG